MGETGGQGGIVGFIRRHPLLTVLYGGGAGLLLLALFIFIQTGRTWSWMAVGGEVDRVVSHTVGDNRSGNYGSRYGAELLVTDTVRVLYHYTVYEVEYQGYGWHDSARQMTSGMPVQVYYNPADPQQSVLMRNVHWAPIMALTFLAAVLLYAARRWQRFRRSLDG